jgi:hypothetical protein
LLETNRASTVELLQNDATALDKNFFHLSLRQGTVDETFELSSVEAALLGH